MKPIRAIHAPDPTRLAEVAALMCRLGPPTIEVVDCGAFFAALEGSHRLAAAEMLGLVPILRVRSRDEVIQAPGYDWFDECFFPDFVYRAGAIVDQLRRSTAPLYRYSPEPPSG